MKRNLQFLIICLVFDFASFAQSALDPMVSPIQSGSYLPGIINIRDYANPGTSGFFAIDYNLFFNSNKFIDRNGNAVNSLDFGQGYGPFPLDVDVSGYINTLYFAYSSKELSFLGNARYMALFAPLYATADFRATLGNLPNDDLTSSGGVSGFGDLTFAPLLLSWAGANEKYDITAGYMFAAPTGRYETGADDNIGLGYWSHMLQLYNYYYPSPQKATAIFVGNTYEIHSKYKDVDVKPGSRYTLEYGVSQYLSERLEVTVQGGNVWQVGKDSGKDMYWDASVKDKYSTIGAGLGFWPVSQVFYTHFKWYTNYGVRQNLKQNSFVLQLIYVPGILGAKSDKN
jgi:hypothetical protein